MLSNPVDPSGRVLSPEALVKAVSANAQFPAPFHTVKLTMRISLISCTA